MTRAIATAVIVVLGALALGACGGAEDDENGRSDVDVAVAVEDFAFAPDALRVKTGTTVTFTNRDGFEHTVTADDGLFDSGPLATDATFERAFDQPGTYPYLCSIHNSMTGSVVVS